MALRKLEGLLDFSSFSFLLLVYLDKCFGVECEIVVPSNGTLFFPLKEYQQSLIFLCLRDRN